MFFSAEFWEPRSAWLRLPDGERMAYLDRMDAAVKRLKPTGVRLVRFAVDDRSSRSRTRSRTVRRRPRYLLVWKVANGRSLQAVDAVLSQLNWEAYFASPASESGRLHLDPAPHKRTSAGPQVRQIPPIPETDLIERAVSDPAGRLRANDRWRESIPAGSCSNIQ